MEICNQMDDTVEQVLMKQLLKLKVKAPELESGEQSLALTTPRGVDSKGSQGELKNATIKEFGSNPEIQEIMRSSRESY